MVASILWALQYIRFNFPSVVGPNVASFITSTFVLTHVIQGEFTIFLKTNPSFLSACCSSTVPHIYSVGVIVSHTNFAVFLHPVIRQIRGISFCSFASGNESMLKHEIPVRTHPSVPTRTFLDDSSFHFPFRFRNGDKHGLSTNLKHRDPVLILLKYL